MSLFQTALRPPCRTARCRTARWRIGAFLLLSLALGSSAPFQASGQAPLTDGGDGLAAEAEVLLSMEWRLAAAESALAAGLPGTAETILRGLLSEPVLPLRLSDELQLKLASSLIAQRRFNAAGSALDAVSEGRRGSTYQLYRAAVAYGRGRDADTAAMRAALGRVEAADLDAVDLPWFYLLRGLERDLSGAPEAARLAFERAREAAVSDMQRAYFNSAVLRQDIFTSPVSDELAAELREQLEQLGGQPAAFPYAREYAVLLYNQGRPEEALEVIDRELADAASGYDKRSREQLVLLKGLILGPASNEGWDTLESLVLSGQQSREVMGVALQLLARAEGVPRARLADLLQRGIDRPAPHPLLSEFYFIRSQLRLADGAIELAKADAEQLLEQFPGFASLSEVYRLLAYAALQRSPPQYRAAADFLARLRDQGGRDPAARRELNSLIADAYFLNGDYANAVDFYKAARSVEAGAGQEEALFLRLSTALVRAGQIEAAKDLIDEADFAASVGTDARWRAEWNLVQAMQARGETAEALERVRRLLEDAREGAGDGALDLRLRWLEARLSLDLGQTDGVGARIDRLLARIESFPAGSLPAADARLLVTELLLLRAEVHLEAGETAAARAAFERLRGGYPEAAAAVRSYLAEGNHYASTGDFESAQRTLSTLASTYPDSALAPQALYEAALYCERRGPTHYPDAIRLHDDLARSYPSDPLVLPARLKQGDLLRQMNNFVGAQNIYETLINSFPEHPRRYIAELSRADCMLALARENAAQLDSVAETLERIMDLPNLPVDFQAEAGYKWGFTLARSGAEAKAREVFGLLVGRLLEDAAAGPGLGTAGRYWIARTLLDYGALLEAAGESEEARLVYLKVSAYGLPGRNLAAARVESLPVGVE